MQTFASVLSRLFLSTSVLVLGIGITTASAQPSLNPVSPSGTLIYTLTSGPVSQCGPEGQLTYQEYTYSSLQYQNNGKNYSIPGSFVYYNSPGSSQGCPPSGIPSTPISLDASSYSSGCTITINSEEGGAYYTSTLSCPTITTATYDPLYQVISVLYSPPGNDSYNGFTDTTSIATNTTIGSNFTASQSLTFTEGFGTCTLGCASVSQSFGASHLRRPLRISHQWNRPGLRRHVAGGRFRLRHASGRIREPCQRDMDRRKFPVCSVAVLFPGYFAARLQASPRNDTRDWHVARSLRGSAAGSPAPSGCLRRCQTGKALKCAVTTVRKLLSNPHCALRNFASSCPGAGDLEAEGAGMVAA